MKKSEDKTAVIIGGTDGIGKKTATLEVTENNARVNFIHIFTGQCKDDELYRTRHESRRGA